MNKCKWTLNFDDPSIDGFILECQHGTKALLDGFPVKMNLQELGRLLEDKEKECQLIKKDNYEKRR